MHHSIRGVGIEYDKLIFDRAVSAVSSNNLSDQINLLHENVLNVDFSSATVIFLYLLPDGIRKIQTELVKAINRGAKVVSYVFSIPNITPSQISLFKGSTKIYFYQN